MRNIRFLQIKFFCYKKGTGRIINLDNDVVIIRGGYKSGRSSLVMSLFSTLGADIRTFSQQWLQDKIVALLKVSIDGAVLQFLHIGKMFYVYDANGLERYKAVNNYANARKLESLLGFNLTFTDNKEGRTRMPMEFMFMPFYISQDKGWGQPLKSFDGVSVYGGKKNALYYYTGVINDDYFLVSNNIEEIGSKIKKEEGRIEYEREFSAYVREKIAQTRISVTREDFEQESEDFLEKVNQLKKKQGELMAELKKLYDKRSYIDFRNQQMHDSLDEINKDLKFARKQKENITCPMCGAHVSNDDIAIYGMIEDRNVCNNAILEYDEESKKIDGKIKRLEERNDEIKAEIEKLEQILEQKKKDISLEQYLDSMMYQYMDKTLGVREQETKKRKEELEGELNALNEREAMLRGNLRKELVEEDFLNYVVSAYKKMGVAVNDSMVGRIKFGGRISDGGSTRTRGVVAYTYGYCELIKKYNGRLFCPIVIDEPNQNGINRTGLEAVNKFIIENRPKGSQLILAVSNDAEINTEGAIVVELESQKELLIERDFEAVRDEVEGLLRENWEMVPYNS